MTGHAYLDVRPSGRRSGATTSRRVIAFAHRGGAYHPEIEGLENTLAAFEHGVLAGAEIIELDVTESARAHSYY